MFTINDIGKKVVSDFFGIGVITQFDVGCKYPVGVTFNCFKYQFDTCRLKTQPDCYFRADGSPCIVDRAECNIKLSEKCDD
jgi:hypothetical protein